MNVSIMHVYYFAYVGGASMIEPCSYKHISVQGRNSILTVVNIITPTQHPAYGVCFSSMTVRP